MSRAQAVSTNNYIFICSQLYVRSEASPAVRGRGQAAVAAVMLVSVQRATDVPAWSGLSCTGTGLGRFTVIMTDCMTEGGPTPAVSHLTVSWQSPGSLLAAS